MRCLQPTPRALAGLCKGWVLLALVLVAGPARADCPASFRDVLDGTERALVAFESGMHDDFVAAEGRLFTDLGCLDGLLEPLEVRDIHLVHALGGWLRDQVPVTEAALRSVLALDPDFNLRTALAVSDDELSTLSERVSQEAPSPASLPLPMVDWSAWRVDGQAGQAEVPTSRPVFLQLVDSRDGQLRTWYQEEGGVPKRFQSTKAVGLVARSSGSSRGALSKDTEDGQVAMDTGLPTSTRPPRADGRSPHRPLLVAGVGVGVLAVAALGTGQLAFTRFQDCYALRDAACGEPWYRLNRGSIIGGYSLVGAAAVLGVTGVVTWRF